MQSFIILFIISTSVFCVPSGGFAAVMTVEQKQHAMEQKYEGTVMRRGDSWIIQVRDGGETTDFLPLNLDDAYKVEGLKVIFSAENVSPPDDVRLVGKPVKITAIKKA